MERPARGRPAGRAGAARQAQRAARSRLAGTHQAGAAYPAINRQARGAPMTDTHDLSRITVLVPGKLNEHAARRIDKTFEMIPMETADPAGITPELAAK